MKSIRNAIYDILLDPNLPLEHKWRNAFCVIMTIVWCWILFDVGTEFVVSSVTLDSFVLKSANIWLFLTLPFGLLRAAGTYSKSSGVSNGVMTYLLQNSALATTASAFIVNPLRPTIVQSTLLMIVIAISTLPRWKLQCLTLVPGMFITSYNAS
eukprot:PhF_6_TR25143/c0_g1_i6/m.34624